MEATSLVFEDSTENHPRASSLRDPGLLPKMGEILSDSRGTISPIQRRQRQLKNVRLTIYVVCITVVVVAGTIAAASSRQRRTSAAATAEDRFICATDDCQKHSASLMAINTSMDPCRDFGAFVCSAWQKDMDYVYSVRTGMELQFLKSLIDTLLLTNANVNAMQKAVKAFRSCVENRVDGERNFATLKNFLQDRNVFWPDTPHKTVHPLDVLLDLSINWHVPIWFQTAVVPARENLPNRILISQSASIGYFAQVRKRIVAAKWSHRYGELYLSMFNVSRNDRDWEEKLFEIGEVIQESLSATFQMKKKKHIAVKIADIYSVTSTLSPRLWLSTLNKHLHPSLTLVMEDEIVFDNSRFPVTIDHIMIKFSKEEIVDNIGWWTVQMLGWLGNPEVHILQAGSAEESRTLAPLLCVVDVESMFKAIIYAGYVSGTFPPKEVSKVNAVIDAIVRRTVTKLDESPWIDTASRAEAKKKVTSMVRNIWPEVDLLRDSRLLEAFENFSNFDDIYINSWITTRRAIRSLLGNPEFASLLQLPESFTSEQMSYTYFSNTLNIVLASFAAPLYYKDGTIAMRYGGLGAAVASEIVKAFDLVGITVTSDLVQKRWWSDESLNTYTNKTLCIGLDESDIFPLLPALEIAFEEYKAIVEGELKSDKGYRLVRSEQYTADQVFFFTFCFYLCRGTTNVKIAPECSEALRHFPPFAAAFHCQTETGINPGRPCQFFG